MNKRKPSFASPLPIKVAMNPVATVAGSIYKKIIDTRNRLYDYKVCKTKRAPIHIISIGGIRAGGSGKTPVTMFIADILNSENKSVGILSRGYRRNNSKPVVVSPDTECLWQNIGDEPAMMRSAYPDVWLGIGSDRFSNARKMAETMDKGSVLLMDDGFQHRVLHRDYDIVCIHDELLNDRILPQGYLREPLSSLSRADYFVFIIDGNNHVNSRRSADYLKVQFPDTGQLFLKNTLIGWVNAASGEVVSKPRCKNPIALCGIARPERFFNLIDQQGIICYQKKAFPDHYIFRERDITMLRKVYSQEILTTEKDIMRLVECNNISKEVIWYAKMRLQEIENQSLQVFKRYITSKLTRLSEK